MVGWQEGLMGKGTAIKPKDLSSIPGTHVMEGEKQLMPTCSLTSN